MSAQSVSYPQLAQALAPYLTGIVQTGTSIAASAVIWLTDQNGNPIVDQNGNPIVVA